MSSVGLASRATDFAYQTDHAYDTRVAQTPASVVCQGWLNDATLATGSIQQLAADAKPLLKRAQSLRKQIDEINWHIRNLRPGQESSETERSYREDLEVHHDELSSVEAQIKPLENLARNLYRIVGQAHNLIDEHAHRDASCSAIELGPMHNVMRDAHKAMSSFVRKR